jgi:hypothetical protein
MYNMLTCWEQAVVLVKLTMTADNFFFKAPSNEEWRAVWTKNIPRSSMFNNKSHVRHIHFEEKFVLKTR